MRKIRIYISGKITGLDADVVKRKFADVKELLEEIGFEAVSPFDYVLPDGATWAEHKGKDITMLMSCDAIYMMDNWIDSKGASIEYDVAKRLDLKIFFESNVYNGNKMVVRISQAIHEVTGLALSDYSTCSRRRDVIYARMMFVHHCRKQKMTLNKIAEYIGRTHGTVIHMLESYDNDIRYNPNFREMAMKVNEILMSL